MRPSACHCVRLAISTGTCAGRCGGTLLQPATSTKAATIAAQPRKRETAAALVTLTGSSVTGSVRQRLHARLQVGVLRITLERSLEHVAGFVLATERQQYLAHVQIHFGVADAALGVFQ